MKVKITKAKFHTYWYANRIGETFEVYDDLEDPTSYRVIEQGVKDFRLINKDDCELLVEEETPKVDLGTITAYRECICVERPLSKGDYFGLSCTYRFAKVQGVDGTQNFVRMTDKENSFGAYFTEETFDKHFKVLEIPIVREVKKEEQTKLVPGVLANLTGIKIMGSPYIPDDVVIVSAGTFAKLKEQGTIKDPLG